MPTNYAKEAFEILREEGAAEFAKSSLSFAKRKIVPYQYRFVLNTKKNKIINNLVYDCAPDPFQTIRVESSQINYKNRNPHHPKRGGGLGQISSGNWDLEKNCSDVENHYIISAFEGFKNGKKWENTAFYEYWSDKYSESEDHQYRNWDNYLSERVKPYEELYYDIKENGYKPNCTGGRPVPGESQPIRNQLEVMVSINRDGEIYFFSGHHRFAISRALGIEIPVHVICRHKQWQELRDRIYNSGLPEIHEDLRGHPDLKYILN